MFPQDIFLRLPTPTALLLLSSLVALTSAHVPRQTPTTIPHRPLNVANYPPLPAPTSPPLDLLALNELLRRQDTNTVCGYINGDASSAATCSAGSHCVKDADANVIGCCPNGVDTCTSGVYTGCVDANSGVQTEVNPYVFTCTQGNVCYSNVFEGGYSQFGCGTATDLAATVLASASGVPSAIVLTTAEISFTQSPSSLGTPTTLGTGSVSSTSAATSSSSSAQSETTGTLTTITIPSPVTTTEATSMTGSSSTSSTGSAATAAPGTSTSDNSGSDHTGAIVGGSIGGVAALVGIAAIAAYLYRRRMAGNSRQGPGPRPGDTQYISPMSGGAAFAPIGSNSNSDSHSGQSAMVRGKTITHITGGPGQNSVWHNEGDMTDHQFLENHPGTAWAPGGAVAGGAGGYRGAYASPHDSGDDEVPLRHGSPEIEDFTQGFHDALSRIGEEDEEDLRDDVNGAGMNGNNNNQGTGDLADNSRPLWLQSRRQSRNLMWT